MTQKPSPQKEAARFRRGVEEFNAGKFFEAHESWEVLWLAAAEPDKTFLQGITQVSAAFHHYTRKNHRGAQSLLKRGLRKLEQFPAGYQGVNLEKLRGELRGWLRAIAKGRDVPAAQQPHIEWE